MSRIAFYTLYSVLALAVALPACGTDAPRSPPTDALADAFTAAWLRLFSTWREMQHD